MEDDAKAIHAPPRAIAVSVAGRDFGKAGQSGSVSGRMASSRQRTSSPHKTPRNCPRVTVRLSVEDHARLKELAGNTPLSSYLRAKALGEDAPRRNPRSVASVADGQMLAQVLGLLGQSRIANNLNQLAYHANIGSLQVDDAVRSQINEAHHHVTLIRAALMMALGLKP